MITSGTKIGKPTTSKMAPGLIGPFNNASSLQMVGVWTNKDLTRTTPNISHTPVVIDLPRGTIFLTRHTLNTRWRLVDIHGWYSLVNINFFAISACKNSRRIWCHYISTSCLRDITGQLLWRHDATVERLSLAKWRSVIVFSVFRS